MSHATPELASDRPSLVFLQPHRDDTCFSLGAFASRESQGLMVTVFTVSGWVHPDAMPIRPPQVEITRIRLSEDQAFAKDAGLTMQCMDLPEAPLMGWPSRDLKWAAANRMRTEEPLAQKLFQMVQLGAPQARPWLFCPAGIGRHIDHLAVLGTILRNKEELTKRYRIAFYEDLHYASRWRVRLAGMVRLFALTRRMGLRRWVLPLDAASIARKCGLIAHYKSQIPKAPSDLIDYSPSTFPPSAPHEAIWTAEEPPEGFAAAPQFELGEALARRLSKIRRAPISRDVELLGLF